MWVLGLFLIVLAPIWSDAVTAYPVLESEPAVSMQPVATATAVLGHPTTNTAGIVTSPPGSLLDRLTRNKPGVWGSGAFYVGLAVVYIVLLVVFFRFVLRLIQDVGQAE